MSSWYGPPTMIGQFRRFRRARAILREHILRSLQPVVDWLARKLPAPGEDL